MDVKLKFGVATQNEGFTPLSTASFSDLRPARIVRELIQNSLDAALVEAGEDTAVMRFEIDPITHRRIPDIGGYESAFQEAVNHQTKISDGRLPDAAQQVVNHIRSGLRNLRSRNATLLSVLDNGIGLDTKRMNSLLGDGSSAKSEDSSGSYGVGHLAPMSLSDIRYMLYGGVTENGKRIVSGRTVLASHRGRGKLNAAQGYLIDGFRNGLDGNLYNFMDAGHFPVIMKRLDQILSEWGHGSVVMIPAFNNFRNDMSLWEVVSKVAAYNFCAAIHQGKLLIEVKNGKETRKLDKAVLAAILEQDKERIRAARSDSPFEGLRPSGQNAYSILKTLATRPQRVEVSGGAAYLSLMSPSLSGATRVDLFRNGMWITDDVRDLRRADFADRQPFHAVVEIKAKESGELHKLVRKAEGPMHDTLSFSLLSDNERKDLQRSLAQIADRIKEQVPEVGSEGYTVDDYLLVNANTDGGGGRHSFSFWGIPTEVPRNRGNQLISLGEVDPLPTPPDVPPNPSPPSPPPHTPRPLSSRPLSFRSAVAPNGEGRLSASIASQGDFPETWLILRVDENTDVTCDRIWQEEEVSMRSFSIKTANEPRKHVESEIVPGGKIVKLHGLSQDTIYELDIEYNTPQELARVVGTPVFRLELHRPPNPPKDQEKT